MSVHAIAFRLRREFWDGTITNAQEWLLTAAISELEYRRRKALRTHARGVCSCEFCVPPFPDS